MDDLGVRSEGGEAAGDTVVETDTKGNDQIGVVHAHVGGVGAVHAGHRDEVAMIAGESAETHEGIDGGQVGEFYQLAQFVVSVGVDDATAGVDKGTVGFPDHLGGATDLAGVPFGVELVAGEMDGIDGLILAGSLEDVLRDIDENGTGTTAGSEVERFVDDARQFADVPDHEIVFGGGTGDAEGVGFLEGVGADELGGDLAGDGDDGDGIHHGVDEAGDEIHGSGT